MLMQVECLEEMISSVPNAKRRFHVIDEIMGIDPHSAIGARTFTGTILAGKIDQDFEKESPCHMVDLFYQGGFSVTTILTDELMEVLFKKPLDGLVQKTYGATCGICGLDDKSTYP